MLDWLLDLLLWFLASIIGPSPIAWMTRRRLRRSAKAFAEGRDVAFPGWALGELSYCRPPGGFLVVTPTGLYSCVEPGLPPTRRDIPVERLVLVITRPGTRADAKHLPNDWSVTECLDGNARVLFACHATEMQYVQHAIAAGADRASADLQ